MTAGFLNVLWNKKEDVDLTCIHCPTEFISQSQKLQRREIVWLPVMGLTLTTLAVHVPQICEHRMMESEFISRIGP